ncbi:MAG: hypothetical protein ACKOBP_01330 [Planctomycetia bacterium]
MPASLPLVTAGAALTAALVAAGAVYRVRGSTAVPAAWWAVAACLALAADAAAQAAGIVSTPAAAARIRLAVAALAVCPAMSLLGAKRPQHGVWQLIVATLAVVVAMPALSAWLVRPGSLPDVHILGRGFLLGLALVGWLNFVATANGPAATAIAAGQLAILRPFLPGVATEAALPQPGLDAAGAALVAAGALATLLGRQPRSTVEARSAAGSAARITARIDPPFLALRDTLGAAWALRIAERFDAVAAERGWPCRLRFAGLDAGGDPADDAWHRDSLRAFKALLRRFVDDAWLARHGWKEPSP